MKKKIIKGGFLLIFFLLFLLKSKNILDPSQAFIKKNPIVNKIGFADLISKEKSEIIILGDIMLGRSVMEKSLEKKNPSYPFEKVKERLAQADLVVANLENPITKDCQIHRGGFTFCAPVEMLEGLKESGIRVVGLANNHVNNYGQKGVQETQKFLKDKQIEWVGLNNLAIKEINGTNFGFLAFDNTISRIKDSDYELIKMADEKVDVLLIMVHWGVEYQAVANKEQRLIAEKIIEKGGDLIVGSHPHWVQNVEEIKGKKVFYSLGNFVFDQAWSEETKKGMAVKLLFEGKELVETEEMPVYMKNLGQPEWVKVEKDQLL